MMDGQDPFRDPQEPVKRENPYKKKPKDDEIPLKEQTVGKTENFFTSHVRLITFIVCVVLFLTFMGPLSVWTVMEIVDNYEQKADEEKQISLNALLAIADKGSAAGWKDFRSFSLEESVNQTDGYVSWTLQVKDEPFYIIVGGYGTKNPPQTIRVYSLLSGEYADLFLDDVHAFVQENQIKPE